MRGVGFSLCRVVRDESELLSIGVAPAYRRRGVAGYLLRASVERARAIGARQMFLEVAIDNVGAQQLYLEHGFERVGMRPDYYQRPNGDRMAAYTMRCGLGGAGGWHRARGGVGAPASASLAHDQLEQIGADALRGSGSRGRGRGSRAARCDGARRRAA